MFIAVAYDIPSDIRRNRLHKVLKGYLTHVQKSVFEGFIEPSQLKELKGKVQRVIKPKNDLVRYYYLCDACRKQIEVTPPSAIAIDPKTIVV